LTPAWNLGVLGSGKEEKKKIGNRKRREASSPNGLVSVGKTKALGHKEHRPKEKVGTEKKFCEAADSRRCGFLWCVFL
jgi:hypothetical protein